jgi:hypothetical protein
MGRKAKILATLWMVGCSLLAHGRQAAAQNPQVTVFVNDSANVAERVVLEAEQSAGRIFRQAGVDVAWVNCGLQNRYRSELQCEASTISNPSLVVRIIPHARTLGEDVFGVSFVDHDTGTYADLFFEPIEQLHHQNKEIPVASILGSVLAHELGHLLLGWNAHFPGGIMQAHWNEGQLRLIAMGRMFFSKEQATKMRGRIAVRHQDRNALALEAANR